MASTNIIACDKCGKLFDMADKQSKIHNVEIRVRTGYYEILDLCPPCLEPMLAPFKAIGPDLPEGGARSDARDSALAERLLKEKRK